MSQIFDALQRSEAENSGEDVSALKEATQILERAERRASSDWETTTKDGGNRGLVANLPRDFATELRVRPAVAEAPQESPGEIRAIAANAAAAALDAVPAEDGLDRPELFTPIPISEQKTERLVAYTDRRGSAAEAFRLLGVRLRHMRRDRPLKRVLITSTVPQEGKSMVAANLACTLALTTKQKTLLIEGDLRCPSLSKMFDVGKKAGICDWLRGERALTACIYQLKGPDFCILPAGEAQGNPLELLQSGKLSTLLDQLASWFEWIIVDSPPILPLADTSVWARLADGILLVARQGISKKKQLVKGFEAIERKKLIGALLNSSQSAGEADYYYRPSDSKSEAVTDHSL